MSRTTWAVLAVITILAFAAGRYLVPETDPVEEAKPTVSPAAPQSTVASRPVLRGAEPAAPEFEALEPPVICEAPPACPECVCDTPRDDSATAPANCPTSAVVCRSHQEVIGELHRNLERSQSDLEACRVEGPKGRYRGTSAHDRRILAAQEKNLLLEFPSWGEELTLPEERVAKFELSADERAALEEIYGAFRLDTHEQLRKLYADLVGDPEAGRDSTINALIHNIMGLAPREDCQERILAIIAALSQGQPMPPFSADMPVCEQAIVLLYAGVDQLDAAVSRQLGESGGKALWSGSSSFTYSTADPPPEAGQ